MKKEKEFIKKKNYGTLINIKLPNVLLKIHNCKKELNYK